MNTSTAAEGRSIATLVFVDIEMVFFKERLPPNLTHYTCLMQLPIARLSKNPPVFSN
jgi:hypothetical protein